MAIYFNTPPDFCYFHFFPKSPIPIPFFSPFLLPPLKPSQFVVETRYGARTLSPATCNEGRSQVNASDLFVALKHGAVTEHPAFAATQSPARSRRSELPPKRSHRRTEHD
ncbi:hypothetical protein S245_004225 [Arachis hypogaea]